MQHAVPVLSRQTQNPERGRKHDVGHAACRPRFESCRLRRRPRGFAAYAPATMPRSVGWRSPTPPPARFRRVRAGDHASVGGLAVAYAAARAVAPLPPLPPLPPVSAKSGVGTLRGAGAVTAVAAFAPGVCKVGGRHPARRGRRYRRCRLFGESTGGDGGLGGAGAVLIGTRRRFRRKYRRRRRPGRRRRCAHRHASAVSAKVPAATALQPAGRHGGAWYLGSPDDRAMSMPAAARWPPWWCLVLRITR